MLSEAPLAFFNAAKAALERASSVDEVKEIRDKAEALRLYSRQVGESLLMQNQCAEIKLRAERRAGELLAATPKNRGGRPAKTGSTVEPVLSDLGVTKKQSHRWQQIASVPEGEFERHISETKAEGSELTSAGVRRLCKSLRKAATRSAPRDDGWTAVVDDITKCSEHGRKFGCVYADPPWRYGNQGTRASTGNHYPTMDVAEIAALPVEPLLHEQAHLHLWTTNAFLFDAKQVIEAWGFEYKSCLVWVKPQMGIGNYWRVSHEFLLLGVRGGLQFRDHSTMSWLQHERLRHSQKPFAFRQLIEIVSPGPYLELFGRQLVEGWTVWGNEISRDVLQFAGGD